jgi:hypothetical protein
MQIPRLSVTSAPFILRYLTKIPTFPQTANTPPNKYAVNKSTEMVLAAAVMAGKFFKDVDKSYYKDYCGKHSGKPVG